MEDLEYIKFCTLCSLTPYSEVDVQTVYDELENNTTNHELTQLRLDLIESFKNAHKRNPTIDEMRNIQSSAYSNGFVG